MFVIISLSLSSWVLRRTFEHPDSPFPILCLCAIEAPLSDMGNVRQDWINRFTGRPFVWFSSLMDDVVLGVNLAMMGKLRVYCVAAQTRRAEINELR
jgi:hypothetical protein